MNFTHLQSRWGQNNIPVSPTPEQLRDDGWLDGVPVRDVDDVEREGRIMAERMRAMFNGTKGMYWRPPSKPKPKKRDQGTRVRCVESRRVFRRISDAAAWLSIQVGRKVGRSCISEAIRTQTFRAHGFTFKPVVDSYAPAGERSKA